MKIHEIEKYIVELQKEEFDFKNKNNVITVESSRTCCADWLRLIKFLPFIFHSFLDFLQLLSQLYFLPSFAKGKRIVFTAKNLCTEVNGILEDRIVRPLFNENVIWINHSKEYYLHKINHAKVYNVGGVVKLLSLFKNRRFSKLMRTFLAYRSVNDSIVGCLDGNDVFTLCYYDLNGLSLAFSKHRNKMRLCEVQHGSIINYPPYAKPSPILIADVFYVKNQLTVEYLKSHLCKNFNPEYHLIPYPESDRKFVPGLHVFYASTMEFNGLHPTFREFLASNTDKSLHVIVRLHPREREKENFFREQLSKYNVNFEFDRSKNWLASNKIENLIVVSPWSSSIEDAYDNGFTTMIIDPVGKERYSHLLDGKQCFYTDELAKTISVVLKNQVTP